MLGMAGKNCVAVACDMRYGAQMQTMAIDKNKVFKMHDRWVRQARHAGRGAAARPLYLRAARREQFETATCTRAGSPPHAAGWCNRLFIGLAGLATDQQTFYEKLRFRMAMYSLREERDIKPASFGKLVSSLLYEKRFGPYFIEPVIAGLDR